MIKLLPLIIVAVLLIIVGKMIYQIILEKSIFEYDETNPYQRKCKRCGAHQSMYGSAFGTWWAEMYPIGNNEKCKCHSFVDDRDW